jgi:hypothetical protein
MKATSMMQGAAAAGALAALVGSIGIAAPQVHASEGPAGKAHPVKVEVLAPEPAHNVGIGGAGWFVDMELSFHHKSLAETGFTGLQLTGPAAHNNVAPFPGLFSTGQDDRNPGVFVMTSTTTAATPGFSGPGTNLANLFNLTGVTDRSDEGTELWDTWLVGAPIAGKDIDSVLTVAEVKDLNHDGIYNDAPSVVHDLNGDGVVNAADLAKLGVDSNIVTVPFHISGAPA